MKNLNRMINLCFGALLAALTTAASAFPVLNYYGFCTAMSAQCEEQRGSTSIGAVTGSSTASDYFPDDGYSLGSASAGATYAYAVDYGRLGAGALAGAVSNAPTGGNPTTATASAHVVIAFVDEITPYSSTLAPGTAVTINYEIPIHFYITSTLATGGGDVYYFNVGWVMGDVVGGYTGAGSDSIAETNLTYSGSFTAYIGQVSGVVEGIGVDVGVQDSAYLDLNSWHSSSADINANFMNTVQLFLEAEDPNVTLFSASGHDYAPLLSSVPEPSTPWLISIGLIGLLAFARRSGSLVAVMFRARKAS